MKYTIARSAEYQERIVDSRFIGYVCPVKGRQDAEVVLKKIRKEHPKATHVCWALRYLNESNGQVEYYFSDAGEPTGTAGKPILSAIGGKELINVLCVVVRYFGGTKLGRGGLVRAYSRVATKVIEKAGVMRYERTVSLGFRSDYKAYPTVQKLLKEYSLSFETQYYDDHVKFDICSMPESKLREIKGRLYQLGCEFI